MNKSQIIGRYIYLACGLIALIVLCFVVTTNANEDNNSETRDVNSKYTIRRLKETINGITIYYPKIEDMIDKDVETNMNENIGEIVQLLRSMCNNNMLISIDYKSSYKGTDYLSFVFKGMMKINGEEMEIVKSLNLNVKNGKRIEITDLIKSDNFSNENFRKLIVNKLLGNGFSNRYVVDENSRFYLEKSLNGYNYVFYFLQDVDSKYYSELRVTKNEIDNALKEKSKIEDDNKKINDDNSNNLINNNQEQGLQIEVIKLDKLNQDVVSDKIMINNIEVSLEENEKIYMYNNRIFLPLEKVANKLGYKIEISDTKNVKVYNDSEYVTLSIDEDRVFFGTENPFKLGEKTMIRNNIIFVPVEFFKELLNQKVKVDNNMIYIENVKAN